MQRQILSSLLTAAVLSSIPAAYCVAQKTNDTQARQPVHLEAPATQTASGIVKTFTKAPTGEIDGFELDDGTTVHCPPAIQAQIAATISQNDRVRVSGLADTGSGTGSKPAKLIEAQTITNLQTNRTLDVDKLILQAPAAINRPAATPTQR